MRIPQIIYTMDLPSRAVVVYCYLCERANKNGECFPAVKTIAADLHLSKSTVFRALADLEKAGLLTRKHRHRTSGGLSSNLYRIGGEKHVSMGQ